MLFLEETVDLRVFLFEVFEGLEFVVVEEFTGVVVALDDVAGLFRTRTLLDVVLSVISLLETDDDVPSRLLLISFVFDVAGCLKAGPPPFNNSVAVLRASSNAFTFR